MLPTPTSQNVNSPVIRWMTMIAEVLAEEAGDEGQRQEDRGDHRELLHHVVLAVADRREVEVGGAGEQVAVGVDQVADPDQVVVDVAEVVALVELEAGELGDLVDRAGEQVALRGHDLAHRDELTLQVEEPLQLLVGGVGEDGRLEVVDLAVDIGENGKEAVGERVEHPVEQELLAVQDPSIKLLALFDRVPGPDRGEG